MIYFCRGRNIPAKVSLYCTHMSGLFERRPLIRTQLLLLICIISYSSLGESQNGYVPVICQQEEAPIPVKQAEPARLPDEKKPNTGSRPVTPVSKPDSLVFALTPTLTVVTKPLGTAKNNASVTFYNGPFLLYTITVTQTAPIAVCSSDLILGTAKIDKGMQLTLQIPGSLQPGSVFLQATFSDLNVPPTNISSMIATWNL